MIENNTFTKIFELQKIIKNKWHKEHLKVKFRGLPERPIFRGQRSNNTNLQVTPIIITKEAIYVVLFWISRILIQCKLFLPDDTIPKNVYYPAKLVY